MDYSERSSPPPVLSIAGSDCSAGAGIQADLKTFSAYQVHGLTAVTCVVAEVPGRVDRIEAIDPDVLARQISILFEYYPVRAVKTGMLFSRAHIAATAAALPDGVPLVVDPVMVASSGDPLLQPDAVELYRERLFPRATVVTPNLDEAAFLLGRPIDGEAALEPAARALVQAFGCAVLLKGGHLRGARATDILALPDGTSSVWASRHIPGVSTHGSGCTFSAAIAAGLGRGHSLPEAVAMAKAFITRAIEGHFIWQVAGAPAVDALDQITPFPEGTATDTLPSRPSP